PFPLDRCSMTRSLLAALTVLLAAATSSAQYPVPLTTASGVGGFGGGFRPGTPSLVAPGLNMTYPGYTTGGGLFPSLWSYYGYANPYYGHGYGYGYTPQLTVGEVPCPV